MKSKPWSMQSLAEACLVAGMPGWPAVTAVAVAWAESGGNAYAVNINDYDPNLPSYLSLDLGAWQTNTHWHPEITVAEALDPSAQAFHVVRIARRSPWMFVWTAWNTYNAGKHTQYMGSARLAVRAAGGNV